MNAPAPGTPEWAAKVTASKVAAILGLSPWESPYSMWLKMRGDIASDDGSNADAKKRGHYLESGVVAWWLDQHPELNDAGHEPQAYRDRDEWAAATPDLLVEDSVTGVPFTAVLDAKTAASDDDWGDEPPAYYLVQSLWQMWVCDADVAYIAVLFGRPQLAFREYRIERDDELIESIVTQCKAFYDSLALDEAPELDDSVATYEAVRAMHPDIEPKGSDLERVEIPRDIAHRFVTADFAAKDAEAELTGAKAALLDAMKRARLATCDGLTVARRQPNKYGVSLVRVAAHIDPPITDQESAA
jgi:putative phage-type endonuclease